jgi:hypothetical protein
MPTMRVSFYRNLVNSRGEQFLSELEGFDMNDMSSPDEAVRRAAAEFEESHGLSHWSQIAHEYRVTTDTAGSAEGRTPR